MVNQTAIPHTEENDTSDVCPSISPINGTFIPVYLSLPEIIVFILLRYYGISRIVCSVMSLRYDYRLVIIMALDNLILSYSVMIQTHRAT